MISAWAREWLCRPGRSGTAQIGCFATVGAAANTASGQIIIPVGFGFVAPAGVYFAGAALYLRGLIQRRSGPTWALTAALAGAGLSTLTTSPDLAAASALASTAGEAFGIATQGLLPSQTRFALVIAAAVGGLVDSATFLTLGFGSLATFAGLVLAKTYVITLSSLLVTAVGRACSGRTE